MKKTGKVLGSILVIIGIFFATTYYIDYPSYSYEKTALPDNFKDFYNEKLEISKSKGARVDNEERLVRYSPGKTPIAILYIHGFGASRAEGEYVTDRVAKEFKANTYYVRLPGHGTNMKDHRDTGFAEYLKTAEDSFLMMEHLGEKVVVMGTSMGGLLTTYLASKYPEKIAGIILASPYYEYKDKSGNLYNFIWGKSFVNTVVGDIRGNVKDPDDPSFQYWYRDQYYAALQNLNDLKRVIGTNEIFEKVTVPVLMFYYYKSEEEQDASADVAKMLEVFEQFGKSSKPNPLNKKVQVEDGAHVLMSEFVHSDKELIIKESIDFINKIAK
ncbi:MAG: alpha/beta hydrolase [Leptospira sp.]|nr:alpha/beta hydrolase [Leptospira sp.]